MYEKSAGCVIFLEKGKKRFYLLLHKEASEQYKESWSFPKGLVEKNEEDKDTARRETKEEAGLTDLEFFPGFRERIHYMYMKDGERISKDVIYFLAKTSQFQAKVSEEHSGYEWLPYDNAMGRLTFKSDKDVLVKAELYLKKTAKESLSKFF
ncbi:MAG TPA: NUDIX domain-containing protein [Candidatus Nanoarchaeia archaeon]|nr:NUDIX domain-containing protein [Candidatus Nanoarchaeia archaeon]